LTARPPTVFGSFTSFAAFVFEAVHLARRPIPFRSVVAVATLDRPVVRLTPSPPTIFNWLYFQVGQTAVILRTTIANSDVFLRSVVLIASGHRPRARLASGPPTFFFTCIGMLITKISVCPNYRQQLTILKNFGNISMLTLYTYKF